MDDVIISWADIGAIFGGSIWSVGGAIFIGQVVLRFWDEREPTRVAVGALAAMVILPGIYMTLNGGTEQALTEGIIFYSISAAIFAVAMFLYSALTSGRTEAKRGDQNEVEASTSSYAERPASKPKPSGTNRFILVLRWLYLRIGQMFCFGAGLFMMSNASGFGTDWVALVSGVTLMLVGLGLRHQMLAFNRN